MPRKSGKRIFVGIAIALAALAGFVYLFLLSAANVRSEPYVIERQHTQPWTLALETASTVTSPVLVVRPPEAFGTVLFDQIFLRMMESLTGSVRPGVPVVLRGEYASSIAGRYTPEALLDLARSTGLERAVFTPVCVSVRRISEPGLTRQVYFVIFESPAFIEFRARLGRELQGLPATRFDPESLSPVLILGGSESDLDRWLPIAATAGRDCLAPITIK